MIFDTIKIVIKTAITMDEPVLYLHTKGAGNPIPKDYQHRMMHRTINFPATAKPEDCQKIVRNMWKHEFTGERLNLYIDKVNTPEPVVCCPYTGKEKVTRIAIGVNDFDFNLYILVASYVVSIYYVMKAILIYTKEKITIYIVLMNMGIIKK